MVGATLRQMAMTIGRHDAMTPASSVCHDAMTPTSSVVHTVPGFCLAVLNRVAAQHGRWQAGLLGKTYSVIRAARVWAGQHVARSENMRI